ncbi:MAG: glycosyltransferase family 2 protein [Parabacteroides gordonii]|jgi:glycosyltransferase involved in cell wall biosynthesis|uniref:glycosyltransferase family 2 protein n=1 Tax=Parabacteroides gordonii TaxID=574930 RepID=UPI003A8C690D
MDILVENNANRMMIGTPVFSIIVPVYNSECFLCECIDSLLAQTYADFELLLIDDGSTDRSGKICDEYGERDSRLHVFHISNQGVSTARNLGISIARGNYINFVDSDDWVTPDYLERYVEARIDYDYDLVYTEMVRVSENGGQEIIPLKDFSAKNGGDLSGAFVYLLECGEFGFTCNKSFKREIITSNSVSFHKDFLIYEDTIFTSTYCLYINSIRLISSAVYFYRSVPTSLTKAKTDYNTYYSTARTGCQILLTLAERQQSDSLSRCIGVFCQQWEQWAILTMYLSGKNISREKRLNYLKSFQYRLVLPPLSVAKAKGIFKIAVLGMYFKNDRIVDLYFSSIGFLYKLKQKYSG